MPYDAQELAAREAAMEFAERALQFNGTSYEPDELIAVASALLPFLLGTQLNAEGE
jgi:hypothetical protein